MADSVFDYEKMLDISVNIVPMGIILFFIVLLFLISPYETDLVVDAVVVFLHAMPFVSLAILTYVAAHYI